MDKQEKEYTLKEVFNEIKFGTVQVTIQDGKPVCIKPQEINYPSKIKGACGIYKIYELIKIKDFE